MGGRGEGTPLVNCRMHPITGNKPKNVGKTRDSVTEGERKTNLREREGGSRFKREGGIDSYLGIIAKKIKIREGS